ncbi:MAG: zinc ribbon domain-containing protein [Candidatus Thorarchaeota archaeon]
MSEETSKKCPKCNATLSKTDTFCGYCGANLEKPQTSQSSSGFQQPPYQQSPYQQPQNTTYSGYQSQGQPQQPPPGYQQFNPYAPGANVVQLTEEQYNRLVLQARVSAALRNAWLTFCPVILLLNFYFFGMCIYHVVIARRMAKGDPIVKKQTTKAIIISVIGLVLNIGTNILFLVLYYPQLLTSLP